MIRFYPEYLRLKNVTARCDYNKYFDELAVPYEKRDVKGKCFSYIFFCQLKLS